VNISSPNISGDAKSTRWRQSNPGAGYSDALLELIAERFRLLSEPLRLKILATLGDEERTVNELVTLLGASQPNISKHLQALAQGGLVRRRRKGTSIYYALADATTYSLCDVVCAGIQHHLAEQAHSFDPVSPDEKENSHADV
jgi:DNA-binding transcriptional ArsR family regulator